MSIVWAQVHVKEITSHIRGTHRAGLVIFKKALWMDTEGTWCLKGTIDLQCWTLNLSKLNEDSIFLFKQNCMQKHDIAFTNYKVYYSII